MIFQVDFNREDNDELLIELAYQAAFNYLINNIEYEKNSLEIC